MARRPSGDGDHHDDFVDDTLDFAKDALLRVSAIAVDVGARNKSSAAGCLGASLWITKKTLDSADLTQFPQLQRRLPKLLKDLERVCAV